MNCFIHSKALPNFAPNPFRVKKERFCYSDYAVSPAFNQSASHGGPIRAGLLVRIAYYEDDNFQAYILRLEIRADSLPSRAEP